MSDSDTIIMYYITLYNLILVLEKNKYKTLKSNKYFMLYDIMLLYIIYYYIYLLYHNTFWWNMFIQYKNTTGQYSVTSLLD